MEHKTTRAGVSAAIPANEMPGPADRMEFFGQLNAKLINDLEQHVGSARPRGDFTLHWTDEPRYDPIQGLIYVVSLSAEYRVEDLPTHSSAYQAHMKERRP